MELVACDLLGAAPLEQFGPEPAFQPVTRGAQQAPVRGLIEADACRATFASGDYVTVGVFEWDTPESATANLESTRDGVLMRDPMPPHLQIQSVREDLGIGDASFVAVQQDFFAQGASRQGPYVVQVSVGAVGTDVETLTGDLLTAMVAGLPSS